MIMIEASREGISLPAGAYYFTQITDTDHSGKLWVVSLLTLIYPLLACCIRLCVKRRMFTCDDYFLFLATAIACGEHASSYVGLAHGSGKAGAQMPEQASPIINHALFSAEILYVVANALAKLSLACFVRRLFNDTSRLNSILCNTLPPSCVLWGSTACLTLLVQCSPMALLTAGGKCPGKMTRWNIVTVSDIATEVAIVMVPTILVSKIRNIDIKHKSMVVFAFAFRLSLIGVSLQHLAKSNGVVSGDHLGFAYIAPIIYLQVESSWSLISTSIPSLRAFLQPLEPHAVPKGTVITAINPVQSFSRRLSAWSGSITAKSERWSDDSESARPRRQRMTAVTTVQGNIRRLGSVPEDSEPPSSTSDWGQIRRDDTWEIQCRRASEITLAGG